MHKPADHPETGTPPLRELPGIGVAGETEDDVRSALVATCQPQILDLSQRQRQAVEAYQGGFISLGRLAEALGLHALEARAWLAEHQIPQNTGFLQDELAEA